MTIEGDLAKYESDLVRVQDVEDETEVALNQQAIIHFLCKWKFQWLLDLSQIIWGNLNNERRELVNIRILGGRAKRTSEAQN
jgi:hypothetical protein